MRNELGSARFQPDFLNVYSGGYYCYFLSVLFPVLFAVKPQQIVNSILQLGTNQWINSILMSVYLQLNEM